MYQLLKARTCNFPWCVLKFSIFPNARTCALSLQSEPLTQHMRAKESVQDREREIVHDTVCVCIRERHTHTRTHRQSESENKSKNKSLSMSERWWVKESVPSERGMKEHKRGNVTWRWSGLGVGEMSGLSNQSTTQHDHTGRSLPCTRHEVRIKLENDACRPPLYSQNKRTKLTPNLNPFSRRVSRTYSHLHFDPYPAHVYTHWLTFCVYTYPCKLCVHVRKYTHQHIQTPCTYTNIWTQTHANSVCIYVTTYTPTQTLCKYT